MSLYRPPCMDNAEWDAYVDAIGEYLTVSCKTAFRSPCFDCVPSFAAAMREQNRCDSTPGSHGNRKPNTPRRAQWRARDVRRRLAAGRAA